MPVLATETRKNFLFRLPHINILWGGGGGGWGFFELTAEAKLSCLSYLVFFIFSHLSVPLKKPLHVKTSTPSARHSVCTPFSANQA